MKKILKSARNKVLSRLIMISLAFLGFLLYVILNFEKGSVGSGEFLFSLALLYFFGSNLLLLFKVNTIVAMENRRK